MCNNIGKRFYGSFLLKQFLQYTALPMAAPPVYGSFHLLFVLFGTAAALAAAWLLRGCRSEKASLRVYGITGIILLLGEIYKQLFHFLIIGQGSYDWWVFPFQLCSIPMYLCLLMPGIPSAKWRRMAATFLLDFGLLGALGTFIDPSGLMHPYLILTVHGFVWHIMLAFLGFYILMSGQADLSLRGFARTLPLFAVCCLLAEAGNYLFHTRGLIDLFYISPYTTSTQLFFADVDQILGRPAGIAFYIFAMIAGAYFIHGLCFLAFGKRKEV